MKALRILAVCLMLLPALTADAQNVKYYRIAGADPVVEGTIVKYSFEYLMEGLPPNVDLYWVITNGQITAQSVDVRDGIWVSVLWDFHQTAGSVMLGDNISGLTLTKNITIVPLHQAQGLACNDIYPLTQFVNYGAYPQPISILNDVDIPYPLPYNVYYQWEYADVIPGDPFLIWYPVPLGYYTDLAPYPLYAIGTKAFRRQTYVYQNSNLLGTLTSKIAYVTLKEFDPGNIYANNCNTNCLVSTQLPFNSTIGNNVLQNPASGGLCANYTYSWEIAYEGMPWQVLGTTEGFPDPNVVVSSNIMIRRKATCGSISGYSNVLTLYPWYNYPTLEQRNYVREFTVLKAGILGWIQADNLPIGEKSQTTTYFDGLMRPIQKVEKEASCDNCLTATPTWYDMVQHIEYDGFGRTPKTFLPYPTTSNAGTFKTNAAAEQASVIRTAFNENSNAPAWSQSAIEDNPAGRITSMKPSGTSWGGNPSYTGVSFSYEFNTVNEDIINWTIDYATGSLPSPGGSYAAKKLMKNITTNEGKRVIEYKDFDNRLILKKVQDKDAGPDLDENGYNGWLCTYYVYDDFNNLRFIITPGAVKWLTSRPVVDWLLNNTIRDELCFYFEFDEWGRTIVKHSPGAGEIHLVYDKKDRLVFSQEQKQRARNQWSYITYDVMDRPVVTGLVDYNATRSTLATYVNGLGNGMVTVSVFTGNTGVSGNESIQLDNPVIGAHCSGCTNNMVNSVTYYDSYGAPGVKTFSTAFSFASNMPANVEPTTLQSKTTRTTGMVTQTKTRVLDANYDDGNVANDIFLVSNIYYDEKGRAIQELGDNYNGLGKATDIVTTQYDFAGRQLATCRKHEASGTLYTNFYAYTKYELDKKGMLKKLYKKYSNGQAGSLTDGDFKVLASYEMGKFGRLKKSVLAPGYNNATTGQTEMESFNYEYNLHGNLTGINRSYLATTANTDQWNHYFGLFLGYDNRDAQLQFNQARLDGSLTGIIWKTQGDNTPRKYDYGYDNAGRMIQAEFRQRSMPTDLNWGNAQVDFSVSSIQYDGNGNLKQLYQKGVKPGQNSGIYIDKLTYNYDNAEWSNRLMNVSDAGDLTGNENGKLEDFNGANSSGNDYAYDLNGNLTMDLNKGIAANGVTYNFLDKIQKITIQNKREIEYIYDAGGEKLGKKITDISGGGAPVKYTWYMSDFVYEQTGAAVPDLQLIYHEEGRVKAITTQNTSGQIPYLNVQGGFILPGTNRQGVYEYFVKDHLGSVRMVLTEETHIEQHECKMETNAQQTYEEANFGNPQNNEVINSRRSGLNTPWYQQNTSEVVRLLSSGQKIGPNFLLKVMAGDKVNLSVKYFIEEMTSPDYNNIINDVINSLVGAISAGSVRTQGYSKEFISSIQSNLNGSAGLLQSYLNGVPLETNRPRAYLNVLYFDEFFNLVPYDAASGTGSKAYPVENINSTQSLSPNTIAPKNGYVFIYLSNHSSQHAFFDDLLITHERGRITEEEHYYPFGGTMSYLHAKAYSKLTNKHGFQGEWSEEDEDTKWNEFDLRTYDPQIGRFINIDPEDEFHSGYVGMGNRPMSNMDPTGGSIFESVGFWAFMGGAIVGAGVGGQMAMNNGQNKYKGAVLGFFAGGAVGWSLSQVPWDMLFTNQINVYITSVGLKGSIELAKAGNAMEADLLWAKMKQALSFGKFKIIQAVDICDAAEQLEKLTKKGKIGVKNAFIDSHGNSFTATVKIGGEEVNSANIGSKSGHLGELAKYLSSNTNVLLGSCWAGGASINGPTLANSLSKALNGATVFSHASFNDSRSLFTSGNMTSMHTDRIPSAQNVMTQINTGTWYKANSISGAYIKGYVRVGNAGKVVEVNRPFLRGGRIRKWLRRVMDYILHGDRTPTIILPFMPPPTPPPPPPAY